MNCSQCGNCKGICPVTFGLALGLTCGVFLMLLAWVAAWWGWGMAAVNHYSTMLSGYEATYMGGVFGFLWGLLKGFVFGFVLVMFYYLICCCKRKCCGSSGKSACCHGAKECQSEDCK